MRLAGDRITPAEARATRPPRPRAARPSLPPIIPAPRHQSASAVRAQRHSEQQKSAAAAYRPPAHARYSTATFNGVPSQQQRQNPLLPSHWTYTSLRDQFEHPMKPLNFVHGPVYIGPKGAIHHGGGLLSAIEGVPIAGAAVKGIVDGPKILKNLGSDVVNLPAQTLKGVEELAPAIGHDIMSTIEHPLDVRKQSFRSGKMILAGLKQDPFVQLAEGHGASGLENHPLYGLMDLAGAEGAVGRTAGAAVRSGLLGEHAAGLASTARDARELAPGLYGDVQHYSPNLLHKGAQKLTEPIREPLHEAIGYLTHHKLGKSKTKMLQKRVDEFIPVAKAGETAAVSDVAQQLKDAMPHKGRGPFKRPTPGAHVVPHAVMGTAGGPEQFMSEAGLHQTLADLRDAYHAHEQGVAPLSPAALKANITSQKNIMAALEHPEEAPAIFGSAQDYAARQREIEQAKQHLGLGDVNQMERRALEPYAITQMGAQRIKIPTERALAAREAGKQLLQSRKELHQAELDHAKLLGAHGDTERAMRQAERKMTAAEKQEERTRGYLVGRYGKERLTKGGPLPATEGERLTGNVVRTDVARERFADALAAHRAARAERKQIGLEGIAAKKDQLKDAQKTYNALKQYQTEKYEGLGHNPGGQGTLRPISNEEIRAHMEANGVPHPAYVRLRAPAEGNSRGFMGGFLRRGGSRGKKFTGQGLRAGAFTPGYEALARSQLGDVRQIQRALTHDAFIRESAVMKHLDAHNYSQAVQEYKQEHGLDTVPVYERPQALTEDQRATIAKLQDRSPEQAAEQASKYSLENRMVGATPKPGENISLVPKTMVDRYEKHMSLAAQGPGAIGAINRQFRNTVLPFSTKWLTGNVTEAALRGALHGAGPGDYALAGRVIKRMRELEGTARPRTLRYIPGEHAFKGTNGQWMQEWGRGLVDSNGVVHTWPESSLTHNEKLGELGERDTGQHLAFMLGPDGHIKMMGWPSGMDEVQARAAVKDATDRTMNPVIPSGSADRLERMATGGLHYGMHERMNLEQIHTPTDAHNAFVKGTQIARSGYSDFVQGIFHFNRKLESSAEKAVLGVHMRNQLHEFSGTWVRALKHQKNYIDKLAHGYADPAMAADAGRYVHDVLGQYDRFSPTMKALISKYAPFLPWYRNALKFVYYSLPAKHPVKQAILLDVARSQDQNFDAGRNVPHDKFAGIPVGDLLSAPKTGPTDFLNFGRYTPMGAFTQGPAAYATNSLVPQAEGIWSAMHGLDPFGRKFQDKKGQVTDTGKWALYALNQLIGEFAGPTQTLHRAIAEHGNTPYNTSTLWDTQVKPGTHHGLPGVAGGFERVFNPFESTHLGGLRQRGSGAVSGPGLHIVAPQGSSSGTSGPSLKLESPGKFSRATASLPYESRRTPLLPTGPQGGYFMPWTLVPDSMAMHAGTTIPGHQPSYIQPLNLASVKRGAAARKHQRALGLKRSERHLAKRQLELV